MAVNSSRDSVIRPKSELKSIPFGSKAAGAPVVLGLPGSIQATIEGALVFFAQFKEAIKEALLAFYNEKLRKEDQKDPRAASQPVFDFVKRKIIDAIPLFNQDNFLTQWLQKFLDALREIRMSYLKEVNRIFNRLAVKARELGCSEQQIEDFTTRIEEAAWQQPMPSAPAMPIVDRDDLEPEAIEEFVDPVIPEVVQVDCDNLEPEAIEELVDPVIPEAVPVDRGGLEPKAIEELIDSVIPEVAQVKRAVNRAPALILQRARFQVDLAQAPNFVSQLMRALDSRPSFAITKIYNDVFGNNDTYLPLLSYAQEVFQVVKVSQDSLQRVIADNRNLFETSPKFSGLRRALNEMENQGDMRFLFSR